MYQCLSANTWTAVGSGGGGGTPSSPVNSVQFNSVGSFGGDAGFEYTTASPVPDVQPTVVTTGGGDGVGYAYYVVCSFPNGATTAGANLYANVSDGPNVLDVTHFNQVSWTVPAGATSCAVYTDSRDGTPSSLGLLGTVTAPTATFRDNGVAGNGYYALTANTTQGVNINGNFAVAGLLNQSQTISAGGAGAHSQGTQLASVFNSTSLGLVGTGLDVASVAVNAGNVIYELLGGNFNVIADGATADVTGFRVTYSNSGSTPRLVGLEFTPVNSGTIAQDLFGVIVTNGENTGTLLNYEAFHAEPLTGGGTITGLNVAFYATDFAGSSTNAYYEWFDSRGVRRVREDNTFDSVGQAIEALYNPQFTKYTPGAADYERVILGQWNGNVAEIGVEKGGTGTLRVLRLIGASVALPGSTFTFDGHTCSVVAGAIACP